MGFSYSRSWCWAGASAAGGEDSPVVRRAHVERDLSFGADEGTARIIGRRAGGNALRGTSRGIEGGSRLL